MTIQYSAHLPQHGSFTLRAVNGPQFGVVKMLETAKTPGRVIQILAFIPCHDESSVSQLRCGFLDLLDVLRRRIA